MPWPTLTNAEATALITGKPVVVEPQRGGVVNSSADTNCDVVIVGGKSENNRKGGIYIDSGASVSSIGGTYRNNGGPDVDNHGRFDSIDDQIG